MSSLPLIGRAREQDPLLVIVPSVSIARDQDRYVIDEKAVSGLHLYLKLWPGTVRCIFREGDRSTLLYGKSYDAAELPFQIRILPANAAVPDELLSDASIVLASGDNWLDFPMADQGLRLGVPVCFVIEYTLQTRLQILGLSEGSLSRKSNHSSGRSQWRESVVGHFRDRAAFNPMGRLPRQPMTESLQTS